MTFSVPRPQPILTGKSRHFLTLFGWIFLNIFPSAKQQFFFLFFFLKCLLENHCVHYDRAKRFDKQTNSCKYLSPLALLLICSAPARVAYRRISIWRVIIDGCSLDSSLHTKPAGGGASNPDGGRRKNDSEWSGTCCWGVFFSNGLDTKPIPTHAIQVRSVTVSSRIFGYLNILEVQF